MKTSWQKIYTFALYAGGITVNGQQVPGWLAAHPEETKFSVNIKRVIDQVPTISAAIQKKIADIELDHCTTMHARAGDPESPKIIVRGEKGELCFTVEATKAKDVAINDMVNREDVEFEPHYATELPKLADYEREMFTGFVIEPTEPFKVDDAVIAKSNGEDREVAVI